MPIWTLDAIERHALLQRFVRYVKIDTQSDENASCSPSTERQKDPKVLDYAIEAAQRQGLTPVRKAIRGGTDGSRLSAMGLLTPNLFAGGQGIHSVQEWVSLEWMAAAAGVCLQLLSVWVEESC